MRLAGHCVILYIESQSAKKNVSTEEDSEEAGAWLSGADEHPRRASRFKSKAAQRS